MKKTIQQGLIVSATAMLLATALFVSPINQENPIEIPSEVGASSAKKIATVTKVTTDNLNLRTMASTKGRILLSIPKGTKVTSNTKVGGWYKVSYKGKTGYVSGSYLKSVSASKKATASKTVTLKTTDPLNLRTGASVKYKRILLIPKGKQVTQLKRSGSWAQVKYGSKTGWVAARYLTSASASSPKAPATNVSVKGTHQTTTALNMRNGGSVRSAIRLTIPQGKEVTILKRSGSWAQVKYGLTTGWVAAKYLTAIGATQAPAVKGTHQTTTALNMRNGGSVRSAIRLTIPQGKEVTILKRSGSWARVKYGSTTGWVAAKYLTEIGSPVKQPTTPAPPVTNWMTQADAEAILSKTMTKSANSTGYELLSHGNLVAATGFLNGTDAKGNYVIMTKSYFSALDIQPKDFGQATYDSSKALLKQMDASIHGFAETQLGTGNAGQFSADIKHFIKTSKVDAKENKTYAGKTFTLWNMGGSIKVEFKK